MATVIGYEKVGDIDLDIHHYDPETRIENVSRTFTACWRCCDCGAAVIDRDQHTTFHEKLCLLESALELHRELEHDKEHDG